MPTASKTMVCPVCGNPLQTCIRAVRDQVTGREFDVLKCGTCGLGVTSPFPEQMAPHYEGYHGSRHGATESLCNHRRIGLVTKMAGPGRGRRLLDVGCGSGSFLKAAGDAGWKTVGTEMNPAQARAVGLEVFTNLEECRERGPFDCITLWHSLEHMPDPQAVMATIRRLVAEDGVVLVAVPDFAGWQSEAFKGHWLHLDIPRHLYHFTRAAMDRMLNQAGLVVVERWHSEFEYDLMGWWQSALNAMLPTPNVLFDYLSRKKLRGTLVARVVSVVTVPIFPVISVPLVWLGSLSGRGGTLLVAARASAGQLAGATSD